MEAWATTSWFCAPRPSPGSGGAGGARARRRRPRLRPQHGVFVEEAVEADHRRHGAGEVGRDLRGRRVHDRRRLVRGLDRFERRAERGRHRGGGAAHRQQDAARVRACPRSALRRAVPRTPVRPRSPSGRTARRTGRRSGSGGSRAIRASRPRPPPAPGRRGPDRRARRRGRGPDRVAPNPGAPRRRGCAAPPGAARPSPAGPRGRVRTRHHRGSEGAGTERDRAHGRRQQHASAMSRLHESPSLSMAGPDPPREPPPSAPWGDGS